jgi:ribonuclease E
MVVDFIDMRSAKNRKEVERSLRDAMKDDKARFTVGRISPNGLLEINRQRLKKELTLRTHRSCPTCGGSGTIASPELVGLNLLRRVETRAVTGRLKRVRVELHPELADAIQNDRRDQIASLEREFGIRVEVIASNRLHRSEEHVEWFHREDTEQPAAVSSAAVTVADLGTGVGGGKRSHEERTPEAPAPSDEGGTPRKRRRGGRRRRKSPPPTDGARPAEAVDAGAGSTAAAGEPAESASKTEGSPKKSRRRRRKKRKPQPAEGES